MMAVFIFLINFIIIIIIIIIIITKNSSSSSLRPQVLSMLVSLARPQSSNIRLRSNYLGCIGLLLMLLAKAVGGVLWSGRILWGGRGKFGIGLIVGEARDCVLWGWDCCGRGGRAVGVVVVWLW